MLPYSALFKWYKIVIQYPPSEKSISGYHPLVVPMFDHHGSHISFDILKP